jgi:hypothetical protein
MLFMRRTWMGMVIRRLIMFVRGMPRGLIVFWGGIGVRRSMSLRKYPEEYPERRCEVRGMAALEYLSAGSC